MVKNYYYLIVGILSVLFSITHALNGHSALLHLIDVQGISSEIQTIFFYIWHIITAENFVFGLAFICMSLHAEIKDTLIDSIAIVIFVALIILGIRVKDKKSAY